jgi:hypothetical protein
MTDRRCCAFVCCAGALLGACGGRATVASDAGSAPQLIASSAGASWLAIDGDRAYWVTPRSLESCSLDSSSQQVTIVASNEHAATGMAVQGGALYWSTYDGSIFSCPASGCGAGLRTVISGQPSLNAISVDGANVYWTSAASNVVATCPIESCGSNVRVFTSSASGPLSIAVNGGEVFWTEDQQVLMCPASGCSGQPQVIADNQNHPWGIAVDATNVYWTDYGTGAIVACSEGGCTGSVEFAPRNGSRGPVTVAKGLNHPSGITVDSSTIYWVTGDGEVLRCAIGGCAGSPTAMATGQEFAIGPVIGVTNTRVVWTNVGIGVFAVPK